MPVVGTFEKLDEIQRVWHQGEFFAGRSEWYLEALQLEPSLPRATEAAGRPSSGGQLTGFHLAKVQEQAVLCGIEALMKAGRMNESVHFRQALAHTRRQMRKPHCRVPRFTVLPNPSIERTSTGLAHSAPQVYVPLRGPSRFRPAHVKR